MSKRKFSELIQNETGGSPSNSDVDESSNCSSVMTNSSSDVPTGKCSKQKKAKKSVQFDDVKVYYFPRSQGFICVPSEGGSTLGMELKHTHVEDYSVSEYAKEQRRLHQLMLEEHRQQGRLIPSLINKQKSFDKSDEDDDDDDDDEEEEEEEDSDFEDFDDYIFLQPISIRQRRTLLRQAGVKKIDISEKERCKDIRVSREVCGCDCKVYCDPETCSCSVAGIKCQVDRLSFPCGCSKDGCGNSNGRIEFNPVRVRTHFIHTLMRLQLEKREEDSLYRLQKSPGTRSSSDTESSEGSDTSVEQDTSKIKSVDLSEFNSNELGSCRDCQNSEVCNIMMQEVQHATLEAEQRNVLNNNMYQSQYKDMHQGHVSVTNPLPHVLLFNDTEEDIYTAENTTSFYNFKQEEASYSETSECSSDTSTTFESNHYQKSYQTLSVSSFDGSVGEEANQEFCRQANPPTNYIHNTSGEQKYLPLNSSRHLYRIGQTGPPNTANQNYTPHTQGEWTSIVKSPLPSTYSSTVTSSSSPGVAATLSSCSYTTMTNTTSDQIAETCPSISSLINNNSQCLEYSEHGINVSDYKQMESYNIDCGTKVYTDLDNNAPPIKESTRDQCLLLESALASTTNKPGGETSKQESSNTAYSIAPIMDNIISSSTSIAQDLSQKFQQNHCNQSVSSTSSNHQEMLRSKVESGQNFGEIIKESMVETVSA